MQSARVVMPPGWQVAPDKRACVYQFRGTGLRHSFKLHQDEGNIVSRGTVAISTDAIKDARGHFG